MKLLYSAQFPVVLDISPVSGKYIAHSAVASPESGDS
jgi:hypothetical protein